MTLATSSVIQRRLTLLLLAARRTDYLKAIFIRLVLLIIVILLILVGLHGRLDVLDPFLERLHAPEARLVIFRPTLRTPHDPHGPLFERPKEATADRARCRRFRGITHADLQRCNRLADTPLGHMFSPFHYHDPERMQASGGDAA